MIDQFNVTILVANCLLYLFSYFIERKYNPKKVVFQVFWLWFFAVSVISLLNYTTGVYFDLNSVYVSSSKKLSIFPFILCYISLFILIIPIRFIDTDYFMRYYYKLGKKYERTAVFLIVLLFLFLLPYYIKSLTISALDIYTERRNNTNTLVAIPSILGLYKRFCEVVIYIMLPYYLMRIRRGFNLKIGLLLLLMFIPQYMFSNIIASRGALFMSLLQYSLMFSLFYAYFPKKIKFRVVQISIVVLIASSLVGSSITQSRFGENKTFSMFNSVVSYFGEPFDNLGFRIWDSPRKIKRLNGERSFPVLHSFVTGEKHSFKSSQEYVDYKEVKSNTPLFNNLCTVFGHLYLEFGNLWFIYLLFYAGLWGVLLKKVRRDFAAFPLILYYLGKVAFAVLTNSLVISDNVLKDMVVFISAYLLIKRLNKQMGIYKRGVYVN